MLGEEIDGCSKREVLVHLQQALGGLGTEQSVISAAATAIDSRGEHNKAAVEFFPTEDSRVVRIPALKAKSKRQ